MNLRSNKTLLWTAAGIGSFVALRAITRMRRHISLAGKVVLITGGSRGLGLVLGRRLARQGARLIICARDPEELDRAQQDLAPYGGEVTAIRCDVTVPGQVDDMVRASLDHFGRIDVLINNAGVIEVGPVEVMTLEDYEEAMKTHYWAALFTILAVLPSMRRRGQGRIVNITSIGGKISVPHLVPYSASKFALVGLSQGLHAELAKDNILVTTVCPGLMRTGSPDNATFKGQHRSEYTWFSLSDALPILSMSAERAARQIINACEYGDAETVLSLPAKLAVAFHGLFPGLTTDTLALFNRFLPGPGGIGAARMKGKESHSRFSPSWLTTLSDRAASRNNELPGSQSRFGDGRL
jgi:NAD(P)-dependent dehydrogenase (short-subunit alcohol dehydrogenase family)